MKQKFLKVMLVTMLALMSISLGVVTFAAESEPGIEPIWDKLITCSYGFEKAGTDKIDIFGSTTTPPQYDAYTMVELEYLKGGTWTNYYTWERQSFFSATIEDTLTVPTGYTYRIKITHQARPEGSHEVLESFEQYSENVITIR